MPQNELDKHSCNSNIWCKFDGQLILYPKVGAGVILELTGYLKPSAFTNTDLTKEIVKVVITPADEVQGPSDTQLRLVRLRVIRRLVEDEGDFQRANYYASRIREIEHEMKTEHEDEEYTDSAGRIMP